MSLFDNRWIYVGWTHHGDHRRDFRSFVIELKLFTQQTWPK